MKPAWHLLTSAAGGMVVQSATGDMGAAMAFFAGGVFIDTDHLVDYCHMLGAAEGVKALAALDCDVTRQVRPARLFLPFHGWEWVVLLLWAGGFFGLPWLSGLGLGALMHLLLDQWENGFRPLGYFFLYRAWNGFAASCALRRERYRWVAEPSFNPS